MKLCRYRSNDSNNYVAVVDGDEVTPVASGEGVAGQAALLSIAMNREAPTPRPIARSVALSSVQLLAPIPRPPSLRDFNAFEEHVRVARQILELPMGEEWYEAPSFYFSNPSVIYGPDDHVRAPRSTMLDYELEVAAVIGREAYDVSADSALGTIAGYTIWNDWSARDLLGREMRGGQGPAKGKDFGNSIGPFLVTPDELPMSDSGRPEALMRARVNGDEWSRGELGDVHWPWSELIAFAGRDTRLVPGDIIGSGTVASGSVMELFGIDGIADGETRFHYLQPGDVVELEVAGLGILRNVVRPAR